MEVLILSCGTGGGHNAAAEALREECERRGDKAVFMDPYALQSDRTVRRVSNAYVSLVQKAPRLFGAAYTPGGALPQAPLALSRLFCQPQSRPRHGGLPGPEPL